jgi:hypothetical protein
MKKKIFIIAFLVTSIFQFLFLISLGFYDQNMWADQAKYVVIGDPKEFNAFQAYGHPGGTVIDGVVAVQKITGLSYYTSITIFLPIFNGLLAGLISVLCYLLSGEFLWSMAILGTLAGDALYESSTPPSAVAALLIVLLCLLTLYIYKKFDSQSEKEKTNFLFFWSLVSGMAVATRADIGIVSTFVFILLLKSKINWKQFLYSGLGAFLSFCVFDPFMWFMPVKHIGDLIGKVVYHYADFAPVHLNGFYVLSFSSLLVISVFLSIILIFMRQKIYSVLPPIFTCALIIMTTFLYDIFLTAHYQAERYFMPIVFIWQVFLPIFIFTFVDHMNFDFLRNNEKENKARFFVKICVVVALIIYPVASLSQSMYFDYIHNALPWQIPR